MNIVGIPGPSLPISIRGARERALAAREPGRADPDWVTRFTTKSMKPVAPEAPLAEPKGAAKVLTAFIERAKHAEPTPDEELAFLIETQDVDLPTTLATFLANGIEAQSLRSATGEEIQIAEGDTRQTAYAVRLEDEVIEPPEHIRFLMNLFGMPEGPVRVPRYGDLVYIAAMQRRIEFEIAQRGCTDFEKSTFQFTRTGELGIDYHGWRKEPEHIREAKRTLRDRWLDRFGTLPTDDDITESRAFAAHYKKPALALCSDEQLAALRQSLKFGDEDPDPFRVTLHQEPNPKPYRAQYAYGYCKRCTQDAHKNCTIAGDELFLEDFQRWEANELLLGRVGYAGPTGWLGLNDDGDDDEFEHFEE